MKRFLNFLICMVLVFSFLVSCNKDPGKQDAGQEESKGAESETGEEDSPNLIEIVKNKVYLDPCGADIFHLEPGDSVWCKLFHYSNDELWGVVPAMAASTYRVSESYEVSSGIQRRFEKSYIEIWCLRNEFEVCYRYDLSTGEWS